MRNTFSLLIALLLLSPVAFSQPEQNLNPVFESAAREFNVPASILKGIAFVETRWMHVRPETSNEGDRHMPPAYGVMGLRDDDWFGHSLVQAAQLSGLPLFSVRNDPRANIRAAAAFVAHLASKENPKPSTADLLSWFDVVAKFPGIPQKDLQGSYAERVFLTLHEGYTQFGIEIESHEIDVHAVAALRAAKYATVENFSPASEDYGPAVWDPSPNFSSRAGSPITSIIVHDTEGGFDGAVSWLKDPVSQASAHYIFRSADGFLKQLVRETDKAWHVRCWNDWTIGIEHEGYFTNPAYFTPIMYQQSALLVRHLTTRYGISRNRLKIVGHDVWQSSVVFPQLGWDNCNTHVDPGQFWNWDYYLSLIVADSTPPAFTSYTPAATQQNVPIYKSIVLKFDRAMDIFSTQSAFSLVPETPGTFRWSLDAKMMTYDPAGNFSFNESYLVSLGQNAKSAGGGRLQQALQFVFTTSALDTTGPKVVRSYPVAGSANISPGVAFQVRFDEPVQYPTFAGRVRLVDVADSNLSLGIGNVTYLDVDDKGVLTFAPATDLQLGHTYRLRFLPGLKDPLNNASSFESRLEFTIQSNAVAQGSTIDPFESNAGQWQQPEQNPGTTKIDSALTAFSISGTFKRDGSYSGKLAYTFSDTTGGVCRLMTAAPVPLSPQNGWLGLWVFGDNSGNQLEFWFTNSSGVQQTVSFGAINWFGWQLVSTPVTASLSSFNSIVVRQMNNADVAGILYADNLQLQISTGVGINYSEYKSFKLHQNFPNPFNPSTIIFFQLERPEFTSLAVFNSLGQQVATLLNKQLEAGNHRIDFSGRGSNGSHLPSGVYMYRLQTSAGVQVRKMVLLK